PSLRSLTPRRPRPPLFPYTTLFRSRLQRLHGLAGGRGVGDDPGLRAPVVTGPIGVVGRDDQRHRVLAVTDEPFGLCQGHLMSLHLGDDRDALTEIGRAHV